MTLVIRYILCSILQADEGDDEMVLPDDSAMGDGDLWTVMVKTMYFQRVMRMKGLISVCDSQT